MTATDIGAEISAFYLETLGEEEWARMFAREGLARHQTWTAEDGWLIGYTTERIRHGGDNEGKFAVMAYRPVGKGARSGDPTEWRRVYFRTFAKRNRAKARAVELYARHSPKWAANR